MKKLRKCKKKNLQEELEIDYFSKMNDVQKFVAGDVFDNNGEVKDEFAKKIIEYTGLPINVGVIKKNKQFFIKNLLDFNDKDPDQFAVKVAKQISDIAGTKNIGESINLLKAVMEEDTQKFSEIIKKRLIIKIAEAFEKSGTDYEMVCPKCKEHCDCKDGKSNCCGANLKTLGQDYDKAKDMMGEAVHDDPSKEQMMDYLRNLYETFGEDWEDDAEVAIYWFANDWHGGQFTNLYSALSTSPYQPGPNSTLESEGDVVKNMYDDLEAEFVQDGL